MATTWHAVRTPLPAHVCCASMRAHKAGHGRGRSPGTQHHKPAERILAGHWCPAAWGQVQPSAIHVDVHYTGWLGTRLMPTRTACNLGRDSALGEAAASLGTHPTLQQAHSLRRGPHSHRQSVAAQSHHAGRLTAQPRAYHRHTAGKPLAPPLFPPACRSRRFAHPERSLPFLGTLLALLGMALP